ncbi:MAG: bifunctional phosphoribosylaminoimidazolecarboxamide formyltransferase/IMP cyclohydrolase [Candidatus Rokuibacteriota bacterium]
MRIRRALVSVHDKTGVVELARALAALGVEILSTGGTARLLRESGVPVREVADVTGFPEMLDGRVKTLHPRIHGGILARRDAPEHLQALERHGIPAIDLVVVALYPFEATVARAGVTREEAIEQIDIGGPAMIRAAAKNHAGVAVVTDPSQYGAVIDELRASGGALSAATRARLATEAFARTSRYDTAIAHALGGGLRPPSSSAGASTAPSETSPSEGIARAEPALGAVEFPGAMRLDLRRVMALRYGENPHQQAAFYRMVGEAPVEVGAARQLHGPELGYNNLLDFSAALGLLLEFDEPAAVVIKHTNPCGVAVGPGVAAAMARAKASDPVSIYGGIVGVNRTLDMGVVAELAGIFVEILFAPAFAPEALDEVARTKKKCRVLQVPCDRAALGGRRLEYRSVLGGLLAQTADGDDLDERALRTMTRRAPSADEQAALRFAWRVAKHVKSNAIVLAGRDQVVGVGAGQMNRLDSARLAVARAREAGLKTEGSVCASDAFFPFRDGLDEIARAGATAVIQPGGSLRDDEVIAAADGHGMAMVFTGIRHFRH